MLYQRRDDNVPVFLLKPIKEIRSEMDAKIEDIKRAASPAPPQSTSVPNLVYNTNSVFIAPPMEK